MANLHTFLDFTPFSKPYEFVYTNIQKGIKIFIFLMMFVLIPVKSYSFDYKSYSKQMHQLRSLSPKSTLTAKSEKQTQKQRKSSALKNITNKLLEALDNDLVPAKLFNEKKTVSVYFKPAKISKLGLRYRF